MPPSVGGVKEITDYFRLFDYDINLLVDGHQADGSEVRWTSTILQFLAAPFVASLILTGIHAYLGVHVVERGVIFVDLSLAQIAALGATIAILLPFIGRRPARPWRLLDRASASPSSARRSSRRSAAAGARIPQEAIIGICYAVASAAAILAMSKATSRERAPQGHARRQHPGRVLARRWCKTALLYGADRRSSTTSSARKFLADLDGPRRGASAQGISIRFWDFLFYASFGFVVTSSVADRRRAARLLLPDRAVGRRDALRRPHRPAPRDRLDDGHGRLGPRRLPLGPARPADRRRPSSAPSASCSS